MGSFDAPCTGEQYDYYISSTAESNLKSLAKLIAEIIDFLSAGSMLDHSWISEIQIVMEYSICEC